jgi:hypothetical protein
MPSEPTWDETAGRWSKAASLGNDVVIIQLAGVPVDGTSGTGAGFAGKGSLCIDRTNAKLYQNTNTKASPTWALVGTQT